MLENRKNKTWQMSSTPLCSKNVKALTRLSSLRLSLYEFNAIVLDVAAVHHGLWLWQSPRATYPFLFSCISSVLNWFSLIKFTEIFFALTKVVSKKVLSVHQRITRVYYYFTIFLSALTPYPLGNFRSSILLRHNCIILEINETTCCYHMY